MPIKQILKAAIDERDFSQATKKLFSILLLSFATFLSLLSYTGKRFLVFAADYSISPDFISGVIALCLIIPLYARGILRWSASTYGMLMFFLFLTVYAALAKLALLGGGEIPIYLVTASIVLSWLGMRSIAGFGWVLAFAAAVLSALSTSGAMGLNGFLFIASAFLGLVMHSNLSPSRLVEEIVSEYSRVGESSANSIESDVSYTKKHLD